MCRAMDFPDGVLRIWRRDRDAVAPCALTDATADAQVLSAASRDQHAIPANLELRDDRSDPGAETGEHEHPGPVILVVIDAELMEETPAGRNIPHAG
jgi:hypothetical protein